MLSLVDLLPDKCLYRFAPQHGFNILSFTYLSFSCNVQAQSLDLLEKDEMISAIALISFLRPGSELLNALTGDISKDGPASSLYLFMFLPKQLYCILKGRLNYFRKHCFIKPSSLSFLQPDQNNSAFLFFTAKPEQLV